MTIGLNHDRADHIVGSAAMGPDRRVRPWLIAIVALAVIGAFCGIVWYAYTQGISQGQRGGGVPLLRAESTPARERPAEPGGVKVPHQDKLVYDQVARNAPSAPAAERILPPPEQPMTRPVAPPPPPPAASVPATPIAPPSVMPAPPAARAPAPPASVQPSPVPAAPAAPAPAARVPSPPPAAAPAPPPPVAAVPAPPPPPAAARLPATPPPAAAPAPDAAAPNGTAAGKYRIQLAAVRESAAAQRGWDKLKSTHGEVLGRLSGQIVRVDLGEPRGVFF
ncbi:MAG: SPOR domain-containing protein, partial [Alphaproteobacteria bacterium]